MITFGGHALAGGCSIYKKDFEEFKKRFVKFANETPLKELVIGLLDYGIETVVVKQGSKGVFAMDNSQECFVESFECDVVDTTGAGDSFNSGFLYSFLQGYDLEKSCRIGNWVASKSIEGFGMDKFPSLKDLMEFI